jgi:hypothetical protein
MLFVMNSGVELVALCRCTGEDLNEADGVGNRRDGFGATLDSAAF